MHYFNSVEQPLQHLIDRQYVNQVNAIAKGLEKMDSVLGCYYDRAHPYPTTLTA